MKVKSRLVAVCVLGLLAALIGCDVSGQPGPESTGTEEGQKEPQKKQPGAAETGETEKTTAGPSEGDGDEGEEAAEKKIELNPDLPEPMFVGTPTNFASDNLDPKTGEPRGDFMVPEGTKLLSVGKPVTSSDPDPVIGEIKQVTDGKKSGYEGDYIALDPGVQWVQIDLQDRHKIYAILLWHYHSQARVYRDVIVQVSNDANFGEGVKTVFNNDHDNSAGLGVGDDYEYVETYEGKLVDVGGVTGRYVRVYGNGNTANEMNHYTEVAVYGKPAN